MVIDVKIQPGDKTLDAALTVERIKRDNPGAEVNVIFETPEIIEVQEPGKEYTTIYTDPVEQVRAFNRRLRNAIERLRREP